MPSPLWLLLGLACSSSSSSSVPPEEVPQQEQPPPLVGHGVAGGAPMRSSSSSAPARGEVRPGAGTFALPAPASTEAIRAGALCPGCDVVLITVCSLRKDHVGAYGAGLTQTPAMDRIAAEGVRFERAYAASNFTLASLTAVLTGRFGTSTGVTGWDKGLVRDIRTLPEILGYYGYRTAAFTTDAPSGFRPDYGLDRGFQHMEIYPPPPGTPDGRYRAGTAEAGATAAPVAAWIARQPSEGEEEVVPLFVMFHSRTAHFPFVVSREGAEADETGMTQLLWESGRVQPVAASQAMPGMAGGTAQQGIVEFGPDPLQQQVSRLGAPAEAVWRHHYARAVERMDADVARVWAALEARGRLDRTVVALVADHGESLNDHGELLHGDAYFDSVVNVPLLLRVPGVAGGTVHDALISQVDVAPTLLELVGALPPADADGVSAVPLLRGTTAAIRHTALAEGGVARRDDSAAPSGAVFAPPWSLLRQDRGCGSSNNTPADAGTASACLFHMDDDPAQLRSVAADHPEVVADLLGRWEAFRQSVGAQPDASVPLSPAFVEELQRNGYNFRLGAPTPPPQTAP